MIRVRGIEKRYGSTRALRGVSFEIERGEVVGFLGPNGAGKSTTLRCLAGFLRPDGGEIEVAGRRVDPDDPESRTALGYLPETTPLYQRMRVLDYLDYVGRVRGMRRRERNQAIGRVVSDCDLHGYEHRRIAHLSRGYRQRVGLAQALLADPEVLLLDEPTSGLDPAEIARIRNLIHQLGETKTVLLSTHILPEVQESARRVLILAEGRLVADGTPVDLARQGSVELHCTLRGPEVEVQSVLSALDTVAGVRLLGGDDDGRFRLALSVTQRFEAAEAVSNAAREHGWSLLELHHELPSLEHVFLAVTSREGVSLAESEASEEQ